MYYEWYYRTYHPAFTTAFTTGIDYRYNRLAGVPVPINTNKHQYLPTFEIANLKSGVYYSV